MLHYFLFATLFSFFSSNNALHFKELRNAHDSRIITDAQLQYLARRSNVTHLNTVLDNICIPRVVGTAGHNDVHNYIVSEMSALGWNVEVDSFQEKTPIFGTLVFRNIIATLNPTAERYLILACHYDSKYFKEFDFVGATDSAVPCAMMINLAYVLKKELSKKTNDIDIKFIFFDGEEAFRTWGPKDSIYGARHLASRFLMQEELTRSGFEITHLDRIDLMVLLDLLGTPNPSFYSYFSDTNKWYIKLVESEKRLAKLGDLKRSNNYFKEAFISAGIEDDHTPFLQKGVPILHVIPTPFPNVWHKKGDNRQIIDMTTVENLNKILRVFVAEYLHLSVTS